MNNRTKYSTLPYVHTYIQHVQGDVYTFTVFCCELGRLLSLLYF